MAKEFDWNQFEEVTPTNPKSGGFNWDEHEVVNKPSSVSSFDATMLGIGQGLTADFGDELGGQIQGLLDRLAGGKSVSAVNAELAKKGFTGDVESTTSSALAKQATEENRELIKKAAEEQPMSYAAGSVLGSIPNAAILNVAAPSLFAGSGIAGLAKAGAAGGAITGLGGSEGGLIDNVVDTGVGAITGGLAGGTIGTALAAASTLPKVGGKAAKYIKEGIEDTSQAQTLKENYKPARLDNFKTFGRESVNTVKDDMKNKAPQKLAELLQETDKAVKKQFGMGYSELSQIDVPSVDIVNAIKNDIAELTSKKASEYGIDANLIEAKMVEHFFENVIDPNTGEVIIVQKPMVKLSDVQDFKQILGDLVAGKKFQLPFSQGVANRIRNNVDDVITKISPKMAEKNAIYAKMSQVLENLELGKISPKGYSKFAHYDANGDLVVKPAALKKIQGVLLDSEKEGSKSALSAGTRLEDATNLLKEVTKGLGRSDIDDRLSDISKSANYYNVVMKNAGKDTFTSMGKMQALLARTGNLAGFTMNALDNGFRSLSNATPQAIKDFANVIATKGTPAAMKFAKQLVDIADKDNIGRNAALFALEQNPAYRDLFSSAGKK
jgi:hypothetical protein